MKVAVTVLVLPEVKVSSSAPVHPLNFSPYAGLYARILTLSPSTYSPLP